MRREPRAIDDGVRDIVTALNRIAGVVTRASCEGGGRVSSGHRHADLAYVLLHHPMPLAFQDFLVAQVGAVARVEEDGVYSRWPARNQAFLNGLKSAAHAYRGHMADDRHRRLRWPLAKLRAQLARQVSRRGEMSMRLCLPCAEIVTAPHPPSHRQVELLRLAADEPERWFAEFVGQHGNALDPTLIEADGWQTLTVRTLRGDFGAGFQRRWLRYRAQMIADLSTRRVRLGVENLRRRGLGIDFFCDDTHAVFVWNLDADRPRGND